MRRSGSIVASEAWQSYPLCHREEIWRRGDLHDRFFSFCHPEEAFATRGSPKQRNLTFCIPAI